MNQLSETQKAWLAGFIDGEGYIGTTFQRKKETKHSAASPRYHPYLIIVNTDKKVLLYIKELIGDGRLYILNKTSGNKRESFQYKLTKMNALLTVLEAVLPYLRVKQEQCKLLISFINKRKNVRPVTGRGSRGITSFDKEDDEVHKLFLLLNKRGN